MKHKQIGFKANVEHDRIISVRANEEGTDKSKFYRNIINKYFDENPFTEMEKEMIKNR